MFFVAVGVAAAAVHFSVVLLLVEHFQWKPLLANVIAWLTAFVVSFSGHHWLSFSGHGQHIAHAAPRFFLISALGFAINESVYALLMLGAGIDYRPALFITVLLVAVGTYALSRAWAFRRR